MRTENGSKNSGGFGMENGPRKTVKRREFRVMILEENRKG